MVVTKVVDIRYIFYPRLKYWVRTLKVIPKLKKHSGHLTVVTTVLPCVVGNINDGLGNHLVGVDL